MTTSSLTPPLRGGVHPIYGIFMGGSDLTNNYTLKSDTPYKYTTQLRNSKQSSVSEQRLMSRRSDVTAISFKGNLEISTPTATEYDKEEFVMALKEQVSYFGLNSLFAISDSNGAVFNLTESSHLFNLDNVIKEHDTRTLNSSQVFTINTDGTSSTTETNESKSTRFREYGMYERFDMALSRLLVESLVSSTYRETIRTCQL